jgi:hypothetical protein
MWFSAVAQTDSRRPDEGGVAESAESAGGVPGPRGARVRVIVGVASGAADGVWCRG